MIVKRKGKEEEDEEDEDEDGLDANDLNNIDDCSWGSGLRNTSNCIWHTPLSPPRRVAPNLSTLAVSRKSLFSDSIDGPHPQSAEVPPSQIWISTPTLVPHQP